MIKKGFNSILLLLVALAASYAQQSVNTSSGKGSGSGGTVSYSVGQIVYSVNSAATGFIVEGVQQPYEISVVTSIETAGGISLKCMAYPNPVRDHLILEIEYPDYNYLSYTLIDPEGRILVNKKIIDVSTSVSMQGLVPACYFLIVYQKGIVTETFKIIKK